MIKLIYFYVDRLNHIEFFSSKYDRPCDDITHTFHCRYFSLIACIVMLQCLNYQASDISKCQFYLDMLSECRKGSDAGLSV